MAADSNATNPPLRNGLLYGLAAYGIWGLLPLFFIALDFASAVEIVANRTLWSLLFCLCLLPFRKGFRALGAVLGQGHLMLPLAAAAALIACNWLVYVYAVTHHQVVQAALGYFINPVVTVVLGVVILKERLRPLQWVAVAVSLVAVGVLTFNYGGPPWLALALAFSFGFYGLAKSYVGREVGAITSLSVETLLLAPLALLVMLWLDAQGQGHFLRDGAAHSLLLLSAGVVTAVPLVLFASAARRLPLSVLGLMQYLAPVIQFLIGVLVLHEAMPPSRWVGFALIWLALAILSTEAIHHRNHNRRLRRASVDTY